MSAEARNLVEELFKLVDKDSSGTISAAEFATAYGTIALASPELLPEDIADLDENQDGEVDRAEWSRRRTFYEEKDVTYINKRNEVYNKKIERAFDPYTAEIRANLERGTAL